MSSIYSFLRICRDRSVTKWDVTWDACIPHSRAWSEASLPCLWHILGGGSWWLKHLSLCHPHGDPQWASCFLATADLQRVSQWMKTSLCLSAYFAFIWKVELQGKRHRESCTCGLTPYMATRAELRQAKTTAQVSHMSTGAQVLGLSFAVGMSAGSRTGSGATRTLTGSYSGCWHCKCQLYPLYHNAHP